jgi:hypothetical protein
LTLPRGRPQNPARPTREADVIQLRLLAAASVLLASAAASAAAEKLKPEELVKRHLEEGLGPAEARTRARVVSGTAQLASRSVGQGTLGGSFQMASDGLGSRLFLQFGTNTYEGETFAFDGNEVQVGFGKRPTSQRTALGNFVSANDVLLREGLFGGVLNASWPLSLLEVRQAKLSSDGVKKLDGRELHRLSYRARKGQNDLTVHLYFEPETFRHVASVYTTSLAQSMGRTPVESSQQSDSYFRLEERFSDFQRAANLTLPKLWALRYEASSRTTTEWKYELGVVSIEPK